MNIQEIQKLNEELNNLFSETEDEKNEKTEEDEDISTCRYCGEELEGFHDFCSDNCAKGYRQDN